MTIVPTLRHQSQQTELLEPFQDDGAALVRITLWSGTDTPVAHVDIEDYWLERVLCDWQEEAFTLTKKDSPAHVEQDEVFNVLIESDQVMKCDCSTATATGFCPHLQALRDLRGQGDL